MPLTPAEQDFIRKNIEQFPHCDSKVVHAPKSCDYCDQNPVWQALRLAWGINFTGETDPEKLPCPSTLLRTARTIHMWPGNRPTNVEVPRGPRTAYERILEDPPEE